MSIQISFLNKIYSDYLIALFVYFVISLLLLHGILQSPGTIGLFHDWFIGPYDEMSRLWASEGFYKWNSQFGNKIYDTDWTLRLLLLNFPYLGGEFLSKGLLIFSLTVSGFSSFCLARRFKLNWYISFATGILYIFSPIIFTKIIAGHLYYMIAYALTPIVLQSYLNGKEQKKYTYFVIAGLLLSLVAVQIHFIIMVFVILLIFSLVDYHRIKKGIAGLFVIFSLTVLVTLSPILFSQIFTGTLEIPFRIDQLLSYDALKISSDLSKSFRMLGYEVQPYSYLNLGTDKDLFVTNAGIIPSWVFPLAFLLPIAGFSALIFRRDKYILSFAFISLIGLFLMKGINPPFSGLFTFLFLHGFYIFRELWHVAYLYSFSITFMAAFFIGNLWQSKLKKDTKYAKSITYLGITGIICGVLMSNGFPFFLGNFAGYVQTFEYPGQYHDLYNKINHNTKNNVLILPYVNPVLFEQLKLGGLDPLITDTPMMIFPASISFRDAPTIPLSIWLLSVLQENKTNNLGNILAGLGIKDVVLRKDFASDYANLIGAPPHFKEKWNTSLEPILDSQKDLNIISDNEHYKIYENVNKADKIFAPSISGGGLTNYDMLLAISNLTSINNVAMHSSYSNNDSFVFIENAIQANLHPDSFISIGKYANSFRASEGWTDNVQSFVFSPYIASRVYQGLFTEKQNSNVSFPLIGNGVDGQVEVWMKALMWNEGGTVNSEIEGKKQLIHLFSDVPSFRIFKIYEGLYNPKGRVLIENVHGRNYVEGLYFNQKSSEYDNLNGKMAISAQNKSSLSKMFANFNISTINNQSEMPITNPIIGYDKVNPTLWKVHVNSSKPITLAFAEPFDKRWQATVYKSGKEVEVAHSIPLYGAINAFQLNQVGNIDIVLFFEPQRWYEIGLAISATTVIICLFYIFYELRKGRYIRSAAN